MGGKAFTLAIEPMAALVFTLLDGYNGQYVKFKIDIAEMN